jgi:hypothetical protein
MTTYQSTTAPLNLFGESRTVELRFLIRADGSGIGHVPGFVATIGRGVARYPDTLTLWLVQEGQKAHRGNYTTVDAEGRTWQFHLSTCVRNRQARIVGFADTAGITNSADQTRH